MLLQIPRIRKPNPRIYGSDDETSSGSTSAHKQTLRKHTKTSTAVRTTLCSEKTNTHSDVFFYTFVKNVLIFSKFLGKCLGRTRYFTGDLWRHADIFFFFFWTYGL